MSTIETTPCGCDSSCCADGEPEDGCCDDTCCVDATTERRPTSPACC